MNEQVEKIKHEIEKWQEHAIRGMKKGSTTYHQGKLALCIDLLDFINSLPDTDRPILTAENVGEIFNQVKTSAVKWSAIEGACIEVAERWNKEHKQDYLQSYIDKVTAAGSFKGVNVDENMDEIRGREDKHYYSSWLDLEDKLMA